MRVGTLIESYTEYDLACFALNEYIENNDISLLEAYSNGDIDYILAESKRVDEKRKQKFERKKKFAQYVIDNVPTDSNVPRIKTEQLRAKHDAENMLQQYNPYIKKPNFRGLTSAHVDPETGLSSGSLYGISSRPTLVTKTKGQTAYPEFDKGLTPKKAIERSNTDDFDNLGTIYGGYVDYNDPTRFPAGNKRLAQKLVGKKMGAKLNIHNRGTLRDPDQDSYAVYNPTVKKLLKQRKENTAKTNFDQSNQYYEVKNGSGSLRKLRNEVDELNDREEELRTGKKKDNFSFFSSGYKLSDGKDVASLIAQKDRLDRKIKELEPEKEEEPSQDDGKSKNIKKFKGRLKKKSNSAKQAESIANVVTSPITSIPVEKKKETVKKVEDTVKKVLVDSENKPKSVLARMVASLQNLYRKWLDKKNQAKQNGEDVGFFSNICRIILNCIDKLMWKIRNWSDKNK